MHNYCLTDSIMKITIRQLRKLIHEVITASDKGVVDFPPEDKTPRMPSGTAIKKGTMAPMIQDLIDMDDPDFKTQGLELADMSYEWEPGTAEKALEDDANSIFRAALGDDINSLSKLNQRILKRIVGQEVYYKDDALFRSSSFANNDYFIETGALDDMIAQITYGDPRAYYKGRWGGALEQGWTRMKQIILQLTNLLVVSDWELTDWIAEKDYELRREKIVNSKNAFIEVKYDLIIHDPYYARLFQRDKIKVPNVRNVEYDL